MNQELIESARSGDLEKVLDLLEQGANINYISYDDYAGSVITNSAAWGHLEIVKVLVEKGAKINDITLIMAAHTDHLEIVQYLVENGANVDAIDTDYEHILAEVVQKGYFEIVKYLVEKGANVDACGSYGCLLVISIIFKHFDITKYLIDKGAEIEDYMLTYCVKYGNLELVLLLISNEADIHFENDELLCISAELGEIEIVQFLIENGAKNNYTLLRCLNPRHIYMSYTKCTSTDDVVDYLLSIYSKEELKEALFNHESKTYLLKFIIKRDLSKYEKVISVFRELGIDVFDLIEKEC